MIRILITLISIIASQSIFGQQIDSTLQFPHHIISKKSNDGVKIRWAPKTKGQLLKMKKQSVSIYRAEIINGRPNNFEPIAEGISPLSESEIKLILETESNNRPALSVAFALYSDWETTLPNENTNKNWASAGDELESKYLALLYSCDLSFETAKMAGLGYEDNTIKSNVAYAYRLVLNDKVYLPAHTTVMAKTKAIPQLKIENYEEGEGVVILAWNRARNESSYSGFYIEKSSNNSTWNRLNNQPYVHALTEDVNDIPYFSFSDSVANYVPHYYRIIGLDAFGEESSPSESIRLMGRDRTPPKAPIALPVKMTKDQSAMNISWEIDKSSEPLSKIQIKKSNSISGDYTLIAEVSNSETNYQDKEPSLLKDQYYQLCAVDTADNYACTYPKYGIIQDKQPPAPPTNLRGTIDTNGIVKINWDMGSEIDLYGYKVHVANGYNRPFSPITSKPIRAISWTDTLDLSTLTEYIYYRVSAMDLRQNASKYSAILRLKKPDLVPPTPSIIGRYEVKKDGIHFKIRPSGSHDLAEQILERSEDGLEYTTIATLSKEETSITDRTVKSEKDYWYRLVAIDDDGNSTLSPKIIKIRSLNPNNKRAVTLDVQKTDNGLLLTWQGGEEIKKTRIYRTIAGKYITFKEINTESTYLDKDFVDQNYKVKVYFQDGSVSRLSPPAFKGD